MVPKIDEELGFHYLYIYIYIYTHTIYMCQVCVCVFLVEEYDVWANHVSRKWCGFEKYDLLEAFLFKILLFPIILRSWGFRFPLWRGKPKMPLPLPPIHFSFSLLKPSRHNSWRAIHFSSLKRIWKVMQEPTFSLYLRKKKKIPSAYMRFCSHFKPIIINRIIIII